MITGLREESMENLQLNAGIMLKNFEYSTAKDADALLELVLAAMEKEENAIGATKGGGSFDVTKTLRRVEADGMRSAYKGGQILDDIAIVLKTTLLEMTPENFKESLGSGEITKDSGGTMTTIQMRTSFKDSDYLKNIVWIGDTANEGFLLIDLENALSTGNATFTYVDKNEGTLPVEFTAHQSKMLNQQYAPFKIIKFEKPAGTTTQQSAEKPAQEAAAGEP